MQSFKGFRISARALIVKENKVLLVSDDGEFWYLPGGQIDPNESLVECVKREVYEETGLLVKVGDLLHFFEFLDIKDHIHKMHFLFQTDIISGNIKEDWYDSGGAVQYRKFFTKIAVKNNKKILPQFLHNLNWKRKFSENVNVNQEIYKGCMIAKGYEILHAKTNPLDSSEQLEQLEQLEPLDQLEKEFS